MEAQVKVSFVNSTDVQDTDNDISIEDEVEDHGPSESETETEKQCNLWLLPWDDVVFLHIFPCLDLKALFCLAGGCSILRQMVHTYLKKMRIVNIGKYGSRFTEQALNFLLGQLCACQKLILKNCKSTLTDSILSLALKNNNMLKHLDVSNCSGLSDHSLQSLSVSCLEITHLSLQNCVWLSPEAITNVALHCIKLKSLDLSGCWHVTDAAIITISLACRK